MPNQVRSAAMMVGQCDEQRLIFDASAAFTAATRNADLDEIWRTYVVPVEGQISDETHELLSRLYSLRMSTLAWGEP